MKELLTLLGAVDKATLIAARVGRLWQLMDKQLPRIRKMRGAREGPKPDEAGRLVLAEAKQALLALGVDAPEAAALLAQQDPTGRTAPELVAACLRARRG